MPYKNAADKQQWEHEHREQRNAKRRRRPLAGEMGATVSISAPDPRFHNGTDSVLNRTSSPEQQRPLVEVGYIVALLVVFVALSLVMYFVRAGKCTTICSPTQFHQKKR
jgi:hypothetical protein